MGKQGIHNECNRLSAAKLHRHQRVQKILANRKDSFLLTTTSSNLLTTMTAASTSVNSISDNHSVTSTSSSELCMSKHQRRKLRNRKSAENSRLRKRQDAEDFKQKVNLLEHENSVLRSLLVQLRPDLLSQLHDLQSLHTPTVLVSSASAITACSSNEFAIQP